MSIFINLFPESLICPWSHGFNGFFPLVLFKDVRFAADAMARLQGFVLLSSERGGIRIEFAKNKMGELGV